MSFLLAGICAALGSWMATLFVRSPRLRSLAWAAIFALVATPILWFGHGMGFVPAVFWIAGWIDGGFREPLGSVVVAAVSMATMYLAVFLVGESAQRRAKDNCQRDGD